MIHPISSAESSLVFLQPHESRPWTSAVWTSQSQSDHPARYYIPTRVGGAWHLSLTLTRGAFQRGKPMLGRKQDTEAGEWGGNSKTVYFFFLFNREHCFWFKELLTQENFSKDVDDRPKKHAVSLCWKPSVPAPAAGGWRWLLAAFVLQLYHGLKELLLIQVWRKDNIN